VLPDAVDVRFADGAGANQGQTGGGHGLSRGFARGWRQCIELWKKIQ
jgi:hypothetical protein